MGKAWHSFSIEKTFREIESSYQGLTSQQAKVRLKKFGLNELPEEEVFSKFKIFLNQLKSPLIYILLIAGVVTLVLGELTDSVVIFSAVFLNTIVGYLQENKASKALDKLKKILQLNAIVFRDNREKRILQKKIVPGDIVFLRAGDRVPADARIIEAHDLKVNESTLTGEWLPAEKKTKRTPLNASLADRDSMVYLGTILESGWGKAVVVKTGEETEIGKVAELVKKAKEKETPYQKKVSGLSKTIGLIIVFICFAIFIEGLISGRGFVEMFVTATAVAIAAIPEGLPVAMTVILAIGMERILRRKGLVRKLVSAETLGNTSIILTDKTGTLTEAKMKVAGIYTAEKELLSDGNGVFHKIDKQSKDSHILALKIGTICNESFIENFEETTRKWVVRGSPTEKALFLAGLQSGFVKNELEKEEPIIDRLLFDPDYKYAATLHKIQEDLNMLYMIGSPEKILSMSCSWDDNGEKRELLLTDFKKLKDRYEGLTRQGLRVLGVAYRKTRKKKINRDYEENLKNMIFVGFFALHDPIRKETKKAIQLGRKAGMRPIIVTGDHSLTAQAVAKQLGFQVKKENILEGEDLKNLSESEFEEKLSQIKIYARVEPKQKLRIVEAWQKRGEIVAMTGDGINDAPALKHADIGVALGSGTDVAKEVSDLVLLTDNFSIIVAAIEEGRAIIDNSRKVITFLLSGSFTEIILISLSLLFGWPLPVLAVQILWVNLIEDGLPDIALAFEKKEKDLMKQKPQGHKVPLLTKEMKALVFIIGIFTDFLLLGLFFWLLKHSGYEMVHIRSVMFASLTIDSLFYVFSCKSLRRNIWHINIFSNKFLIGAWLLGVIMLLSAIYLPALQTFLKTMPLSLFDWGLLLGLGLINLILIELTKYYFISRHQT